MSIDRAMEMLAKGPIHYEVGYPIVTVERLIELWLVNVSEPYWRYCPGTNRQHLVRDVTLLEPERRCESNAQF